MEELICLYAMLANQGLWHPLRTCIDQPLTRGERLLSPEASFLTLEMLRETPRPYPTNAAIDHQLPVYWKTGTSSGYRDGWAIGIFGPYALAVWMGDFRGKSNTVFLGAANAAPLFFHLVEAINQHLGPLPDQVKAAPEMNLTKVKVCEASGLLPNPHCPQTVETWFIPGKSPITTDHVHREIAIDRETGLRTYHIGEKTQFAVYEFWPSDLLKIFAQAGIQRRIPPAFQAEHSLIGYGEGDPPQIISPQQNISYVLRLHQQNDKILFTATADADVHTLYWFVNHQFIGSSERDRSLAWEAKGGSYSVRVVDNHGRTAVRDLVINTVE